MIKTADTFLNDPNTALSREWLVTNGTGGYASSSVIGANTRRYHGLLVASFPPPLERQVLLSKVDEELVIGSQVHPLGTNEYHDGTLHPHGYRLLRSCHLELGIPSFEYASAGVRITKQVWMEHRRNTVYVKYRVMESDDEIILRIRPFCAFRGYHQDGGESRRNEYMTLTGPSEALVTSVERAYALKMLAPDMAFVTDEDWYHRFLYRVERERGFDCLEDLYTPGFFTASLSAGESVGLIATAETQNPDPDIHAALEREIARRRGLVKGTRSSFRKQLLLAADQFVVSRPDRSAPDESVGISILAGYHWFTDWGRDTMISLPGLLLSTERFSEARELLLRYIECANGGMIPNRFADDGSSEYNTADATLWYFQALHSYVCASGDTDILHEVFPRLAEIIERHTRGTRFGIRVDPSDGLLFAGEDDSQLTWMDARVGGHPVTPRIGKPVEINALWFNALSLMSSWAQQMSLPNAYEPAASECARSFRRSFWCREKAYLYDVVDGIDGNDDSLRPNQIMAVSLPHSPLTPRHQRSVVDAVEKSLLTPFGLRTLSPDDPRYARLYHGGSEERDSAYHQGTVWPWLLGQFADAHYRVYRDKERIRDLTEPFKRHLSEAGIGSISEVFDGDSPHTPGGCIAQAWSVAEILRISTDIDSRK